MCVTEVNALNFTSKWVIIGTALRIIRLLRIYFRSRLCLVNGIYVHRVGVPGSPNRSRRGGVTHEGRGGAVGGLNFGGLGATRSDWLAANVIAMTDGSIADWLSASFALSLLWKISFAIISDEMIPLMHTKYSLLCKEIRATEAAERCSTNSWLWATKGWITKRR